MMTDMGPAQGGDTNQGRSEGQLSDAMSAEVSSTARSLFSAGDVGATLARIVFSAVDTIEGCDYAGVFVVASGGVSAPASTDLVASELDALQQQLGEGPCLDAIERRGVVYADDLAGSTSWPVFAPAAVEAGVRSALSLHLGDNLGDNGTLGALNCYGAYPQAFGSVDRAKAVVLATLAGLALSTAQAHQAEDVRAARSESALATREVIGQAQGILMERERVSADQAFDLLRRASQHLNVKLRDVAQRLVDTGEDPTPGPSRQQQ